MGEYEPIPNELKIEAQRSKIESDYPVDVLQIKLRKDTPSQEITNEQEYENEFSGQEKAKEQLGGGF